MKKSSFLISLFYTIITFVFIGFNYHFIFDDSYDSFCSNLSTFQFTPFSFFDLHYLLLLIIKDILKPIQDYFPTISIFSTIYILANVFSLFYFIYTINSFIFKKSLFIKQLLYILICILFIENIISITHTRFSSILTGLALINLLFKNQNNKKYIHYSIFIIAFLFRPESAMGSLLIVSFAYLLFHFNLQKYISTIILPLTLSTAFFLSLTIQKQFTNRFEILIEPDIEYAIGTNRIEPLSKMRTYTDSLRYEMAVNTIFIDPNFVNVKFLRSLVDNQFHFNFHKFYKSIKNIFHYYIYYLIFLILFLIIFLFLLFKRKYCLLLKLIIYQLFICIILSYLDYNVSVADRHFVGINMVVFCIHLIYFYKYLYQSNWKLLLLVTIALSFGTYISFNNAIKNQIQVYEDVICLEKNMALFEEVFKNQKVIVNVNSFHLLDKKYSFQNRIYTKNTYYLYDAVNFSTAPRNIKYLSSVCKCDASNAAEFLTWVIEDNVIFLITEERSQIIERYMKVIHHKNIKFVPHELNDKVKKPLCNKNIVLEDFTPMKVIFI